MNQQLVREHRIKYKLNWQGDKVQVERHWEQSSDNEADVRPVWGEI